MKTLAVGFLLTVALIGCGGGSGSSGSPTPITTSNPATYTATLHFIGTLAGHELQSELRDSLNRRMDSDTATPVPVMLVAPLNASGCFGYDCASEAGPQGQLQAVVSPAPSSTPTTTFTQTAEDVQIYPTGTPSALPAGVVGETWIGGNGTANVQTSGTATATIGSPVSQSVQTAVYQYFAIAADCIPTGGSSPGWAWNGTNWVAVSDPTQADIYVTGSSCSGGYGVAGDQGTLNVPGGATFLSTDTPFSAVTASQCTTTSATAVSVASLLTPNADGSINAELCGHTRSGVAFKVFPNSIGGSVGAEDLEGAAEVSGAGVDGF